MINLSKLLCISFLFISGCGAIGGTSREAARAACTDLSDFNESDFDDLVELARLSRDSGGTKEVWNSALGSQCVRFALDFSSCSQCVRAVGNFAWGS
jgi:hypothetical protein